MNPFALDMTWVGWLAGLLLHAIWIGTAAGLLAWLGLLVARDPRTRHAWALAGLTLIILGLASTAVITWPAQRTVAWHQAPVQAPAPIPAVTSPPVMAAVPMPPMAAATGAADWRPWAVLAWSLGVLVLALRQAVGWWRVAGLRRSGEPAGEELRQRVRALCSASGMAVPQVLVCARLAVPAAIGWLRPAVLLPASLVGGLPAEHLEALILHELAHLRRHDWLVELALSLVESLLFFHPAVWWLGRQLREAREQCCDQAAVSAGAGPEGLARALLAIAERTATGSPALAATGGSLTGRVRRILGFPERRPGRFRALVALLLLPLLLGVITACAAVREAGRPGTEAVIAGDSGRQRFSLERRIRARADGRQVSTVFRMIDAPTSFWIGHGLAGEDVRRLGLQELHRLVADAVGSPDVEFRRSPSVGTFPLQLTHCGSQYTSSYIAGYTTLGGRRDPVSATLTWGETMEVRTEARAGGGVTLASARVVMSCLLGWERLRAEWSDGRPGSFPFMEPVLLVGEAALAPDTGLDVGESIALPLPQRIEHLRSSLRTQADGGIIRSDGRFVEPDLPRDRRRMCIITATPVEIPVALAQPSRIEGDASWLDGIRVTLDAHEAALPEVLERLAAQLPVPIDVRHDADLAQTRVTITARNEPPRAVLQRLLPQTLLDATADATGLHLATIVSPDFPAPGLSGVGSSPGPAPVAAARGLEDKSEDRVMRVKEQLEQEVPFLDPEPVQLVEVVAYLRGMGYSLRLDPALLVTTPPLIRLGPFEKRKLRLLLDDIMRQTGFGYTTRNEVILITNQAGLRGDLVLKRYDVSDLVAAMARHAGSTLPAMSFAEIITQVVAPASWTKADSGISIEELNGSLAVNQTAEVHLQIEDLLLALRRQRAAGPGAPVK